jgi:copper transporter 1
MLNKAPEPAGAVAPKSATNVQQAPPFRPTVLQQAVRALLHVCQFIVAYFVML